ncbi:alpha-galactosidase [Tropicimonas marinistellae]|uniref:family 4 glycosyl hydrolase n=1 Tax=Tropicimonas marinistellae TaxID=1739787 RepID=UPI0008362B90|nr:alpha-galactosidase [Tropicimonas marinistellae]
MHDSGFPQCGRGLRGATEAVIAYVGGGSLNWAPTLMGDLAAHGGVSGEVRLFDIDRESAERNAGLGNRYAKETGCRIRYAAEPDLTRALSGADVVVISILPGSFEAMASDLSIPAAHGIAQSVGDTVGPGGFMRALRAIPMMAVIGRAIAAHAPRAFVCNLTNPMSVLTGTLHAVAPEVRSWGECHEVTKLRQIAARIGNQRRPGEGYTHRDVQTNVLGINHFTFVDAISLDGMDLMDDYLAFADAHSADGWRETPSDPDNEWQSYFEDVNRVKFDLTSRYGIAAAAGDRHLAEFLPQSDYLAAAQNWGFGLTPVEFRMRDRDARAELLEGWSHGDGALPPVERSAEAFLDQIVALLTGEVHISNANLPNRGQVAGLPAGAVVETNAVFSGLGVQPIQAGRLPAGLEAIVADHAERQSALVRAVLAGDRDALFPLFASDPALWGLGEDQRYKMYTDMLAATAAWLPETLTPEAA